MMHSIRSTYDAATAARSWRLYESGHMYDTIEARSSAEALDAARDGVDRTNYDGVDGTLYIDIRVVCVQTGERDWDTVILSPEEPPCISAQEHDWRSPYSVLGGLKENPGVWGHGGGVIITAICAHCGRYRVTDTWAQRPDTGEQGLTEVEYREPDDDSLAYVSQRRKQRGVPEMTEE